MASRTTRRARRGLLGVLAAGLLIAPAAAAESVATGEAQSCGVIGGSLKCWGGDSTVGALGTGAARSDDTADPQAVKDVSDVTDVKLTATGGGSGTTGCVLTSGGAVKCWGSNAFGQFGDGTKSNANPTPKTILDSGVTKLSVSTSTTCVVQNGGARCAGSRVGNSTNKESLAFAAVTGMASGVTDIAAGWRHNCAVQNDVVSCWGDNTNKQLGYGPPYSAADTYAPKAITTQPPGKPVKLAAGVDRNCVLNDAGAVYCWGNAPGVAGVDDTYTPTQPTGLDSGVTDIAMNWDHTCVIKGGEVWCWADGGNGQLGNGTKSNSEVPVKVSGLSGVTSIAVGNHNTCAMAGADAYCWGDNSHLQLGTDAVKESSTPVKVIGATPKPTPQPTPTPTPAPQPTPTPAPVKASIVAKTSVKLSSSGSATLATIACPAGATCKTSAAKTVKVKLGKKTYSITISGFGTVKAGKKQSLVAKLSKTVKKALGRRTVTVKVKLTTTVNGVASSKTLSVKLSGR